MISEEIIDAVLLHFDGAHDAYVREVATLVEHDPGLLAYLSQESNDILTEEEKDILWYIVLVIYRSINAAQMDLQMIDESQITVVEESNWETLSSSKAKHFTDKVTPFFVNYPQEDLLAFVEDAVEPDEDSPISAVGREVIFVTAKTLVDYHLIHPSK